MELARRLVVVGARECNGGTVAAGLDAAGLDERVVGDAEVVRGRLVAEHHDASAPALEDRVPLHDHAGGRGLEIDGATIRAAFVLAATVEIVVDNLRCAVHVA